MTGIIRRSERCLNFGTENLRKMKLFFKSRLPLKIFLFMAFTASAQTETSRENFFWITGGAGATSASNARWELSAGFSGNFARQKNLFGARLLFNQEFIIMKTALSVNEFALYA